VRHGDVVLAGTLTLPPGPGPHPGVVLITGRGPHDRAERGPHRPFHLLADTFARAGTAVLRTDDRGTGRSTGSLATATYDDLAGDALAGVALLRARPEVDPARVGLLGHSEGGYLAPLAAAGGGAADGVAFVVRPCPERDRFLLHDPAPALRALPVPVLALFGGVDRQVAPEQNEGPMRALLAADPDATVRTLPGLDHRFRPSATGDPAECATIPPEVLDVLTTWMDERFG
jgi:hypothetical protein